MTLARYFLGTLGTALLSLSLTSAAEEMYLPGDKFSHDLANGGKGPEMVVVRPGKFVFGGGRSGELKGLEVEDERLPVTGISWDRATAFASWLSHQTGHY